MSSNIVNSQPFIKTSRKFPEDAKLLALEVDRTYLEIANSINARIIGNFATLPSITGEAWFFSGSSRKQQTLRQVYLVTGAGNIPHGIKVASIGGFTRIYGTFTDGTIWYPLPFVSATAANNQVSITVTATNIVITAGGGSPPTISSGFVVLEWLSQV